MNEVPVEEIRERPAWQRGLRGVENGVVIAVLALLVILPLIEAVLRKFTNTSIKGGTGFVQHFTLLVSVLGGAIAAREGRLLSLSSLTTFLKGRWLAFALIANGAVATAVSALLCVVGWQYVLTQPSDSMIAYGISTRAFQILLPVGYGLVAARLWWHSSPRWTGRWITLALAAGLVWVGCHSPVDPGKLVWPALITLLVATVLGAPVFTTLGGAAMILFWGAGRPAGAVPLEHYELVTQHVLASLPLFTLAGYFLAEGGASKRLVRLFRALFGPLRGGPAIVTVLVCAFFTSFTGASGVTILALGGLLMPVLIAANYSEKSALGLVTGAGSLGLLFPPCLPLIVYATIAQLQMANMELPPGIARPELSINQLFLGGLGPGVVLVLLTAWWGIRAGPREAARPRFDNREVLAALNDAKWELILPMLVLAVMFTGLATPVEAAAVAALYALLTQTVVHRDLHWTRDVPRVVTECGLLIGGVLLILGVAMGLTNYLVFAEVPSHGVEWVQRAVHSKWVFLLLLNLFLLVVGCLMDVYSAIVVVVPLIVPMGVAFGVDPVHLGIIFLANLELGFLTPPVGMNLFLASYRFRKPMIYVTRAVLPMLGVLLIGVLLITYVPPLTTTLPKLFKKSVTSAPR
ncbi:MAG: C4-dicarboxylate transporter, DctM subunit [Verrucomicrobiota bacterium]|jgi:tripartite ATP-independent transporter DctM subunit